MLYAVAALALAGCGSFDHLDFPATGRDARTFNPQTGRYEWPDDPPAHRPARRPAPDAAPRGDTGERDYNPQTGRFDAPRD